MMSELDSRIELILDENKRTTGFYGPVSFVGGIYQLVLELDDAYLTEEERIDIEKELDRQLREVNREFYIKNHA